MGVGAKDGPFESNATSVWVRWKLHRLCIAMVVVGWVLGQKMILLGGFYSREIFVSVFTLAVRFGRWVGDVHVLGLTGCWVLI